MEGEFGPREEEPAGEHEDPRQVENEDGQEDQCRMDGLGLALRFRL